MATSTDLLPSDMNPDIRPDLTQGDSELPKETPATSDSSKTMTPDNLRSAESDPATDSGTLAASSETSNKGVKGGAATDNDSGFSFSNDASKSSKLRLIGKAKKKSKKGALLGLGLVGGGVLGAVLVIMILIFGFLGSLKYVHFATILRTVAFAQFTNTMRQAYSQTLFDASVLDPASTGSFDMDSIGSRNILDLVRGINPQAELEELGNSGSMKFLFNENKGFLGRTTNSLESVTINSSSGSTTYNLDDYAKAFGPDLNYNDLSTLQQLQVRNTISSDIRSSLYDDLALDSRDTTAALKGLQAAFNFKLVGFADYARDFLGKTPKEAEVEAEEESYNDVQGGDVTAPKIDSENEQANSDAQAAETQIEGDLTSGELPNVSAIVADNSGSSGLAKAASDANKLAGLTLLYVGYCSINDLMNSAQQADLVNQTDAVRQAALVQSRADQIETGDVNAEAVGGASAGFDNAEQSSLYQADTGATVTGPQSDLNSVPTLDSFDIFQNGAFQTAFSAFGDVLFPIVNELPVGGGTIKNSICTAVLNPVTQITLGVFGVLVDIGTDDAAGSLGDALSAGIDKVLTSPDGAAAFISKGLQFGSVYEIFNLAGSWLQSFVQKLDGLDYSGLSSGPSLYNQASVGTDYMAQSSSRTISYGRPLSDSEETQSQGVALASVKKTLNSGLYNRYFSIDNPFSLLGSVVADLPSSFTDLATDIQSAIPSLINKFGSFLMNPSEVLSLLPGHSSEAQAAGSATLEQEYNYFGVQQWGWSQSELNTIETDPSYSLVANTNYVAGNPATFTKLNDEFMPCYTSSVQYTPADPTSTPSAAQGCSAADLSTPDALHWRKYMLDQYVLTQLSTTLPSAGDAGGQ